MLTSSPATKGTMAISSTSSPAIRRPKFSPGKKVLATAGVLGAVASVVALGTFGTFGGSTSASQKVDSGSAGIDMPYSTFSAPISGVMPGDTVERAAALRNTGTSTLKNILLTTTAAKASALTTDAVNGLQFAVDGCSVPWRTIVGGADACDGAQWSVLPSTPVANLTPGTPLNTSAVSAGATDYLRATFKLPATADSSFQNLDAELNFQFDGLQRDAQYLD